MFSKDRFPLYLAFFPWVSPPNPPLEDYLAKLYYIWEYKTWGPVWQFCEHDLGYFWFTIIVGFIPAMLYIAAISYPGFYEAWTLRPFFQTPYSQVRLSLTPTDVDGLFPGCFHGLSRNIYFAKMAAPPAPPPRWEIYYFYFPDRLLMISPPPERWIPSYVNGVPQSTPPLIRVGIRVDFDFEKVVYVPADLSHFPLPTGAYRWAVAYMVRPDQPSPLLAELMRYGTSDAFRSFDGGEILALLEDLFHSFDWTDPRLPSLLFGLFVVERVLKFFGKKTRFFPFPW